MIETKLRIIPMTYDRVFKSVMKDKECRGYLVSIISKITKLPEKLIIDDIVFKNEEQPVVNISEKKKITDLIVDLRDCVINIEMNKDYYEGILNKNFGYVMKIRDGLLKEGEDYDSLKKVIQINFDNYELYDERIVIKFEMIDQERNIKEGIDYESYHINLKRVKEKYYNKDDLSEFEKELLVMTLKDEKDLENISNKDEILKKVADKIKNVSMEEELQGWYDEEEQQRYIRNSIRSAAAKEGRKEGIKLGINEGKKVGLEEGKKVGLEEGKKVGLEEGKKVGLEEGKKSGLKEGKYLEKIKIAKKLLKETSDINLISRLTSLSKNEIESLNKK